MNPTTNRLLLRTLAAVAVVLALLWTMPTRAAAADPIRFFIDFPDLAVTFSPDCKTLQVSVTDKVLSYGSDFEVKQTSKAVYTLQHKMWKGFFLKVDVVKKTVFKVQGSKATLLKATVATIGEGNIRVTFDKATNPYLVAVVATKTMQVAAADIVFSYCTDWTFAKATNGLFHLKQANWQGFFWAVATDRKEAYEVTNGTFGRVSGKLTKLPFGVRVVEAPAPVVAPTRFQVQFPDMALVFGAAGTGQVQVSTGDKVLSYGADWSIAKLAADVYHLKQAMWKDFFFKVNTTRKDLHVVKGGSFGKSGGTETKLVATVALIGGNNVRVAFDKTANPYLVHEPKGKTVQIAAYGYVMSYGSDWQVKAVTPAVYDLKENFWKDFFWKVDTTKKVAFIVTGGTFGAAGGTETRLPFVVVVTP